MKLWYLNGQFQHSEGVPNFDNTLTNAQEGPYHKKALLLVEGGLFAPCHLLEYQGQQGSRLSKVGELHICKINI